MDGRAGGDERGAVLRPVRRRRQPRAHRTRLRASSGRAQPRGDPPGASPRRPAGREHGDRFPDRQPRRRHGRAASRRARGGRRVAPPRRERPAPVRHLRAPGEHQPSAHAHRADDRTVLRLRAAVGRRRGRHPPSRLRPADDVRRAQRHGPGVRPGLAAPRDGRGLAARARRRRGRHAHRVVAGRRSRLGRTGRARRGVRRARDSGDGRRMCATSRSSRAPTGPSSSRGWPRPVRATPCRSRPGRRVAPSARPRPSCRAREGAYAPRLVATSAGEFMLGWTADRTDERLRELRGHPAAAAALGGGRPVGSIRALTASGMRAREIVFAHDGTGSVLAAGAASTATGDARSRHAGSRPAGSPASFATCHRARARRAPRRCWPERRATPSRRGRHRPGRSSQHLPLVGESAAEAISSAADEALPRHDVRLPDERARLGAHEGDARVARLRRGAGPRRGGLILFNTCSIREKADDKFSAHLGQAKRLKREDPERIVGVGGCWAQSVKDEVFAQFPFVDVAFGPGQVHKLAEFLTSDSITAQGFFEFEGFTGAPAGAARPRRSRRGCRSPPAAT